MYIYIFFFKQKTAYEIVSRDWSSDVCSSDLAVYQAEPGEDEIYPDGLILAAAQEELRLLSEDDRPFFLAVGFIRPHLPFGAPAKYLEPYQDRKSVV